MSSHSRGFLLFTLLLAAALPSFSQGIGGVGIAGGTVTARADSPSGGGCTGSSPSWTCSGTTNVSFAEVTGDYTCYTADGSVPVAKNGSCPNGTHYTGAISVAATTTLQWQTCRPLWFCSPVSSSTYTISAPSASVTLICTGSGLNNTSAQRRCSVSGTIAANSTVVIVANSDTTAPANVGVGDSQNGAYTLDQSQGETDGQWLGIGHKKISTALTTGGSDYIYVTSTDSHDFVLAGYVISPSAAGTADVGSAATCSSPVSSCASGTASTTVTDICVAGASWFSGHPTYGVNSPYTLLDTPVSNRQLVTAWHEFSGSTDAAVTFTSGTTVAAVAVQCIRE